MKEIQLTKGMVAFVDDEDFERLNQHSWYASLDSRGTKWYAKRRRKKTDDPKRWTATKIRLSHAALDVSPSELPPGCVVDHVNHDGLDCRKFIDGKPQLEIVTQEINMARSKGWKKKVEPFL